MQTRKQMKLFTADKKKVGVVVARFNQSTTNNLLDSAIETLLKFKVREKNITVISVAGVVEIPFVLQNLAQSKKFDCLVALGAVIRGETPHFDYVSKIVSEGVLRVSLDYNIPIGFGVLTLDSLKQAPPRFKVGGEAVAAALELVKIKFKN